MTSLPQHHDVTVPVLNHKARWCRFVSILAVVGLLSACADDTATPEDRRFANQASTETVSATTPDAQTSPVVAPTVAPQASPESLLDAVGAPRVIFALIDGDIDVIDTTGGDPSRRIPAPNATEIIAIASSPSGNQVAALLASTGDPDSGSLTVVLYDLDGEVLERWDELPTSDPVATPAPDAARSNGPVASISFAPDGSRVLVAPGDAQLVNIEVEGEATALPVPEPVRNVAAAAWSPDGEQVGLLARNAEGSGAIWVFSPYVDGESMRQVAPPNADAADLGSVTSFAWLQDSSGFAYILSDASGLTGGGQLYTVNIKLGIKLLVATPGRGGPAAGIVDFALAPDGASVAYTIAIPVDDDWQFHSLWVRSMQSPVVYGVPAGDAERVGRLWWVAPGLAWEQQSGDALDILLQAPGAAPRTIFTPGAPLDGTPGATPMATPVIATPVIATPGAATPSVATPGG